MNIAKRQSCCGMDAPLEPRSDGPTCRRISFRLRLRISATGVLRFTDRQTPPQRRRRRKGATAPSLPAAPCRCRCPAPCRSSICPCRLVEASPDYQSDLRPPAAGTASLFLRDLDFGFGRRSPACAGCPWQASPTNQRPRCREKFRNAFSRQFAG